jgi:endonuclease III
VPIKTEPIKVSSRRIRAVHRRLGGEPLVSSADPGDAILDGLIGTILSQHTSDTNSARAFASLKKAFPTWAHALDAPTSEIAAVIRSGGLAEMKAPRIKAILTEIEKREGRLDLSRLYEFADGEVDAYLRSLPGVGPKTAACVLVFSMGRAAFPIDTHVHRVTSRLGWIKPKTGADKAHEQLAPQIPPDIRYSLHVALIRHGRQICKARHPLCTGCPILDFCEAGPRFLADGEAR